MLLIYLLGKWNHSPMLNASLDTGESIFKNTHKGKHIITSVVFKLNKNPNFNTSYGAIKGELERMGVKQLSIKAISDAVISIRKSKLPDPKEIGNSGSFF